jgi:hypothetical protein
LQSRHSRILALSLTTPLNSLHLYQNQPL